MNNVPDDFSIQWRTFSVSQGVVQPSGEPPAWAPLSVTNAPAMTTTTTMCGMPCYQHGLRTSVMDLLTHAERSTLYLDYAVHSSALADPERIIAVRPDQAEAHLTYRQLCEPGSFCVRRDEAGSFVLVHRPRPAAGAGALVPLVRTPLEFSAQGWRLHVPETARPAWNGVRDVHFSSLDALKAALPPGMKEVTGASLCDIEATHL
ncbi:hypothetical protein [Stenotrophomonas sp. CFBP 13725]|uniref:hypothetical protein n=1 Tax=Stenotrophomonas sp. CFBP 13725 TaxID=2775297 RepID=UPI0017806820|nr:hypothetical protein [Stenotrophomonas sp. CFBP 13725]MBD8637359.1 hypothetical protein [Stenotrophomonas sp. CFBP 13725]